MTTPPLVLLDLDGTLTDSAPIIRALARATFADLGLPDPGEAGLRGFVGPGLLEGFTSAGVPADLLTTAIATYRARYVADGIPATRAFDGIADQLRLLRDAGLLLAVATSKPEPLAVQVVRGTGLEPLLDGVFGAPPDGVPSTKADVIAHALTDVGPRVPADGRTLMVGDREHDVRGAAAHGIGCLGVAWGDAAPGELAAAGALTVIPQVGQLAAAVLRELSAARG
ncbi:MAG: HAD hydrolase-like protein [Actinobacteria bacterium]|nr:HAD hydrolase-like protein [Actinomycetota bacterium]MCG2796944.1 HAD hydrolase-like protein [Cellulomonas sp.]